MRTPTPWVLPHQPSTRADLIASGATPRMLRTRLASGDLVQVRRGVYVRASDWPTDPADRHLVVAHAEQAAHPAAVISHQSAALAWGLLAPGFRSWPDEDVSVTLPTTMRGSRGLGVVRHVGPLPASQVYRDEHGYVRTTPARTAVDLASGLSLPDSLVLLDSAARRIVESVVGAEVRRRDYANPTLQRAARELLEESAATVRAIRLLPAIALADPSRESAAESLTAGHVHLAGLPLPEFNAEIRTPHGSLFPDFLWAEHRLIGEVDGKIKYADPDAYQREKVRQQVLLDMGYRIVRWLAREIMLQPRIVMDRIGRALGV